MYLKSVELNGFKSFGKKTELSFTTPVTAIVGPNGSGKSNVVEGIRFVLGEQSMKSMRGKSGTDLIFKGSKHLSKLSRAIVVLTFDNRDRVFTFSGTDVKRVSLDFDEVAISREVFSDGGNTYRINGTEVRLKDIIELLSSVNIGSSGHHIISQGEADRILNSSSRDRREMIEDALGLKIYQYRLRESEKKLEKTQLNMKEVESLRREIAPHINFLKKQIEKIEKSESMRQELGGLYGEYLMREEQFVKIHADDLKIEREKLQTLLDEFSPTGETLAAESDEERRLTQEDKAQESILQGVLRVRDELSRKVGRIEGILEGLEKPEIKRASEEKPIPFSEVVTFSDTARPIFETILGSNDVPYIHQLVGRAQKLLTDFTHRARTIEAAPTEHTPHAELEELRAMKGELLHEMEALDKKRDEATAVQRHARETLAHIRREKDRLNESKIEARLRRQDTENKLAILALKEQALTERTLRFDIECKEAGVLVGEFVFEYKKHAQRIPEEGISVQEQEDRYKKIERLKIKLEDAGALGGADVMKEYNDVSARDQFLLRELSDLGASIEDLRTLMHELKVTLDREFKEGIEKINIEFQKYFALMFGGGNAFLSLIIEQKRKRKNLEEDEDDVVLSDTEEEDKRFEHGIDINVSLPHKKVRELSMLSGGERSLTSIALLFAISQVNPPPFLVLDETDAALDEANSRKYGNMIESLSGSSELIVVTHNRETMSRAGVLYGVTVGADGASKLLTIRLEEAVKIAK